MSQTHSIPVDVDDRNHSPRITLLSLCLYSAPCSGPHTLREDELGEGMHIKLTIIVREGLP